MILLAALPRDTLDWLSTVSSSSSLPAQVPCFLGWLVVNPTTSTSWWQAIWVWPPIQAVWSPNCEVGTSLHLATCLSLFHAYWIINIASSTQSGWKSEGLPTAPGNKLHGWYRWRFVVVFYWLCALDLRQQRPFHCVDIWKWTNNKGCRTT